MEDKNLHSGHRKRLKANVCKNGFTQLEEHQLLELMLFYSIPRADTNDLAHRLIKEFGSLKDIFSADIEKLKKVDGIGENTAIMLAGMGETFRRISTRTPSKRKNYKSVESLKELSLSVLGNANVEQVILFCFDGTNHLKKQMLLGEGDGCSASLDLRKAVQAVIDCGAAFAVLAHNHPFSTVEPSAHDIDSTRVVSVMLRKLGFSLADHIIVNGEGEAYSMHSDSRLKGIFY